MDVRSLIRQVEPGKSVVVHDARWSLYQDVLGDLHDRHVFVTFTGRRLELMLPTLRHVRAGELLATLVRILAGLYRKPFLSGGSTTLQRGDLRRGLEPDKSFYFQNVDRMIGRDNLDLTKDPPPDLVIEIAIDRRSTDRLRVYRALQVPEIWMYDEKVLRVYSLTPAGQYESQHRSPTFPRMPIWITHSLLNSGLNNAEDDGRWETNARQFLAGYA